jgi:hypothetical protein
MPPDVPVPYDKTLYDVLAHPELGPLSVNATVGEVQQRFLRLGRHRDPAAQQAFHTLRAPGKRLGVDIFCSTLKHEQQSLQALVQQRPAIQRLPPDATVDRLGPELLALETGLGETRPIERRAVQLSAQDTYAEPPAALGPPPIDI